VCVKGQFGILKKFGMPKVDVKEMEYESADWFHVAQDTYQRKNVTNVIMNS
jgi:hypothetical protein